MGRSSPPPHVERKLLTAAEANELTIVNEGSKIEKDREELTQYIDVVLLEVMDKIVKVAEEGGRNASIAWLRNDSYGGFVFNSIKFKLKELGYILSDAIIGYGKDGKIVREIVREGLITW